MKLINEAVTTLKEVVVPASVDSSPACLDACKCSDPDACEEKL